ncbi:hypothetical protein JCM33374_g1830 [Metschnikowia sp. JCM 33374]|nr:hypothetical protein JCM33374_g1830 [Metschnikowia sp. JCM 33374]
MDHNSYNHAVHTAANPPVGFNPTPAALSGASSGSSPTSPEKGSMNYSPRHSRKPTSLSSSQGVSSKLRSPLKSGLASLSGSLQNSQENVSQGIASINIDSDGKRPNEKLVASAHGCQFYENPYNVDSSTIHADSEAQSDSQTLSSESPNAVVVPEELQEIALTYAYPEGPANVLNSVLYLYSDPDTSHIPLDINDYDLVVNVARECEDLSPRFDNHNGTRKYLRVPWSHTSKISKELPMITQEIAAMDKPGKRILVHCQCGVSRSACVVVAYFMVKFKVSVNEAYELLKSGTINMAEACSQKIKDAGNHVDACERICPNMNLIFELMDFGDKLKKEI